MDQRYRDSFGEMKGIVKAMYDAGVPIVAGTDNGPVGFQLLRELELYVQAGIPAPQVLRIATIGAATRDASREGPRLDRGGQGRGCGARAMAIRPRTSATCGRR